jgi:hypothetical protein
MLEGRNRFAGEDSVLVVVLEMGLKSEARHPPSDFRFSRFLTQIRFAAVLLAENSKPRPQLVPGLGIGENK